MPRRPIAAPFPTRHLRHSLTRDYRAAQAPSMFMRSSKPKMYARPDWHSLAHDAAYVALSAAAGGCLVAFIALALQVVS